MTLDDALRQFGLSRLPAKHILKILRDTAAKSAHANHNDTELRKINEAWAVLTGKADATAAGAEPGAEEGPSGMVQAQCRLYKHQSFILDWTMRPRAGTNGADKIMLGNPQTVTWDDTIGRFCIADKTGATKPYPLTGIAGVSDTPFAQHWTSTFEAELAFAKGGACPHCEADHFQWCQHCHTIFCHFGKEHYPNDTYTCPSCDARYTWNGSGKPIKTVFDGKHLRALCDLTPDLALQTHATKQLSHRQD